MRRPGAVLDHPRTEGAAVSTTYVRRALGRLGVAIDPAENHLDADVEDQALARMLDMVEALKRQIARIPETLGIDPIVVVWGEPAPRSEEVWVGFDGSRDGDVIAVVEKRTGVARTLTWGESR